MVMQAMDGLIIAIDPSSTHEHVPFQKIPRLMIRKLVISTMEKLNYFPTKVCISDVYSPRLILQLGNSGEHTIGVIYLQPLTNLRNGHELMGPHIGTCITRQRVIVVPITAITIQAVNKMGEEQVFKSLCFKDYNTKIFFDLEWIGGVGCVPEDEDEADEADEADGNNGINGMEPTFEHVSDRMACGFATCHHSFLFSIPSLRGFQQGIPTAPM